MERAADPFLQAPPPRRSESKESPTYPSAQEDLVPASVQPSPQGPEERLTPAEVRRRCSAGSCLVLCGRAVYDVSGFVRRHPGGERLLRKNAGQDVSALLRGPPHQHSENALRWLEQYRVGTLLGEEADRREDPMPQSPRLRTTQHVVKDSRPTKHSNKDAVFTDLDPDNDLVDWSKPLLWQVGHLRDKYDVWVHQPVDRPIRLFYSDFIESCSKTAWYIVLSVWVPVLLYLCLCCYTAMANEDTRLAVVSTEHPVPVHKLLFLFLFLLGVFIWSLLEYCIHRFVFHMKAPASSYLLITLHFLLHGLHHKSPYDSSRLVFPPLPASLLFGAVYGLTHLVLPNIIAKSLVSGILCGYIIYDMTHYYLHYGAPPEGTYLYGLKAYHVKHHFKHQKSGFGITSTLWDRPFNTLIPEDTEKKR